MRLTRANGRSRVLSPELIAAVAGVVLALVATFAISGIGSDSTRQHGPSSASSASVPNRFSPAPHMTPTVSPDARAVMALTAWLQAIAAATAGGSQAAQSTVASIAPSSLRSRLAATLPSITALIHARVIGTKAPSIFATWPLGYRVLEAARSHAVVSVWHLDIGASSALGLASAGYETTTCQLRLLGGAWRIESVHHVAGPTPPPADASAVQLDAFARAASAFTRYGDVP